MTTIPSDQVGGTPREPRGGRVREALRHPFWQTVLVLVGSYLLVKFGIAYIPALFGMHSAPVPRSVVLQYMLIILVGVLIYVSADEPRWALLAPLPLLGGWARYQKPPPRAAAPFELRSTPPAPPGQITFRGKPIQ